MSRLGIRIAQFDDKENGVHTEVWQVYSNGSYKYYVHTQDTDSNTWLPAVPMFTDKTRAITRAENICKGIE